MTKTGTPAIRAALPVARDTRAARPPPSSRWARTRGSLLESFQSTDGIERAMDYIFYQVAAINGFDSFGHYLRAGLLVNQCSTYAIQPRFGCSANFSRRRARAPRGRLAASARPGAAAAPSWRSRRALGLEAPEGAASPSRAHARPRGGRPGGRGRAEADATPAPRPRRPRRRRPSRSGPRRCSTTCSEATNERRAAAIAGNPVLIGAATVLVRAGRRLPGLQRQPGPAVRADLPAPGRGAERGQPRGRQRRAHRRRARRLRRRDLGASGRTTARRSRSSTSRSSATSRRCRRTRR